MTEKLTICLIGPKKGGKSSLLASLVDCVAQSAFGYSPRLRPALQPILETEFYAENTEPRKADLLNVEQGDYERLRREFAEGGVATDTLDTYEYRFRLTVNGEAPPAALLRGPWLLEIVDSAGEIAVPPDGAEVAILNDVKAKLAGQMLDSDAIVIVLPLVRLEDSGWSGTLARLIDRLTLAQGKKLKRLIVVFSQYERLFARLGPSAFTYACDPAVALHTLRKSLRAAQWLDRLRALEAPRDGVSVRFTVCSAYGFAKRFQNPNIDPHQPGERRFRRAGLEGARAYGEYWRPFLTAEPIIYAALGLDSAFTFSYAQLDARGEEAA
ncbi:hypothetical protein V3H18_10210 [Methylocystis sp. 9N]|uniref:Double-GTPase 2 domain-containing protein n=1 Tax=Methylocystis borbori TaxID=3118750 RepID=A0ABU7XI80_9HYPH